MKCLNLFVAPLIIVIHVLLMQADAWGHGTTMCVGMVTRTTGTVALDLRIGVGLIHEQLDTDQNATVSEGEWTSSVAALKSMLHEEIVIDTGSSHTRASRFDLALNNGVEVRVQAEFGLPPPPEPAGLRLPFLARLRESPTALLTLWEDEQLIRPPSTYLFSDRMEIR